MDDIVAYDEIVSKLRSFFREERGFVEVPAQSRQSILAACEDPRTISKYQFSDTSWPLPQTGQMWLEYELLKNPKMPGVFCLTTSYRDEPNPIPGRHDKIFPMFEFESHGDMSYLTGNEVDLLDYLGFKDQIKFMHYEQACNVYNTTIVGDEHERKINQDCGSVAFLTHFPERTHPFWNMKHIGDGIYAKVDVLLHGMETIGSAERSTNPDEMRNRFLTISDGKYAKLLFDHFGENRVMKELEEYLSLPMIPRFGGGIGITRMARAMHMKGILERRHSIRVFT